MNFLQLGQNLALECGVSGTLSTMSGQVGSLNRIVTWVNQAWNELQTERDDWDWMRSSGFTGGGASFATVAGQAVYPLGTGPGTVGIAADNFGKWCEETFRNYTTTVGVISEIYLDNIPYDDWRNSYMYGAMRTVQTRPVAVAIAPDKSVCVGPPSNGEYTVTADYFVAPTLMVDDTDVPFGLPKQFHMLINYMAMQKYGRYEAAPEVLDRGQEGERKIRAQVEAIYGPRISYAGALC